MTSPLPLGDLVRQSVGPASASSGQPIRSKLKPLRDYQAEALDKLRVRMAAEGCHRVMLQAPCGAGKTVCAAHIIADGLNQGKRTAFVVPSISLIDQSADRFDENGIGWDQMGVIQADHPWRRPSAPVQVCSVQTLQRRSLPMVDQVIVDEAHIQNLAIKRWMVEQPNLPFMGLSATPWSKGLGQLFTGGLIKVTTTAELIAQGALSPFRVYAPSAPDLEGVETIAGDWHQGQLDERVNKATLVGDIVASWLKLGNNDPTICFAVNLAHARNIHERFLDAGVVAEYIDADTPREMRDAIGKRLASGETKIAVSVGTLIYGIDWDVRCIILGRPTKSEMFFVQAIGRGLRTVPGFPGKVCTILDHSDTHARLGFVTEIDRDELCDGKPKPKAERKAKDRDLLPKACTSCTAIMPATERTCPQCGASQQLPAVFTVEGELTPFGDVHINGVISQLWGFGVALRLHGDRILASPKQNVTNEVADLIRENREDIVQFLSPARRAPKTRDLLIEEGKQAVYSGLLSHAYSSGYKDGWAARKYKEIFNVWPRGLSDERLPPSLRLRGWIKSEQIRYAKSREGASNANA